MYATHSSFPELISDLLNSLGEIAQHGEIRQLSQISIAILPERRENFADIRRVLAEVCAKTTPPYIGQKMWQLEKALTYYTMRDEWRQVTADASIGHLAASAEDRTIRSGATNRICCLGLPH